MASLTTIIAAAGRAIGSLLHPRENISVTGTLGALNAEVQAFCDGCSTVAIDLRGTFSHTVAIHGTVDGTNWTLIPVRPQTGGIYVLGIVGTASGVWMASCAGYTKVRAIVTAYTSGGSTATLVCSNALFDDFAKNGGVTSQLGTITAATGVAATLSLAAPGLGLRHYLTYLRIVRSPTVALTASATPTVITTTNLPGTLAFTMGADAAPIGQDKFIQEDFAYPVTTVAQNTATTIVCPAVTGVIWRVTAGFYVAP